MFQTNCAQGQWMDAGGKISFRHKLHTHTLRHKHATHSCCVFPFTSPAVPHLPTSRHYGASRLSSAQHLTQSPANPAAPHQQSAVISRSDHLSLAVQTLICSISIFCGDHLLCLSLHRWLLFDLVKTALTTGVSCSQLLDVWSLVLRANTTQSLFDHVM